MDLDKAFRVLCGNLYEPLGEANLRNLTQKTLFLSALAADKRVSELQALYSNVIFHGNDLILSYLPEFIAKTESESNLIPGTFSVRSLLDFVGGEDEERLL